MRIEIDLATPGWPHVVCIILILLSIPEVFRRLTQCSVHLFAYGYRAFTWAETWLTCFKAKKTPEQRQQEIQREIEFKSTTPQEVAEKLKEDNEFRNFSGYVSFKWGFPYIFRTRHLQLYKTTLLIRDADAMRSYNKKRLELSHQHSQFTRSKQSHTLNPTQSGPTSLADPNIDTPQDQSNLADLQEIDEQSIKPITSRHFPPPRPLYIFDFKGGKAVNSRLPMTLKLVNKESERCYLEFRDKNSYAYWCSAISKNLHIELTEKWRTDARQMLNNMQHDQQQQKLQQSTPVKKRPVLTSTATGR